MRNPILVLIASLSIPVSAAAQQPSPLVESYLRATQVIDAAVAAHGGLEALRASRQMRFVLNGHEYHRFQSRRVSGAFDSTVFRWEFALDVAGGRMLAESTRGYPGGFYYTTRTVTSGTQTQSLDLRNRTWRTQQYQPVADAGQRFFLPQFFVLYAAETTLPRMRRSLGRMKLASGAVVDVVTIPFINGTTSTLGFDTATHLLRADMSIGTDAFFAEHAVESEFLDYRLRDGLMMPGRRVSYRHGDRIIELRLDTVTRNYAIPDSVVAVPAGFAQGAAPSPTAPVRTLAPGVWAITAGSAGLLVEFSDHLVLVDASTNMAAEVLRRIDSLAPGKPVRYVIPTHHHDDHFTGVRLLAPRGAITVTTPGNAEFFRRVVTNPPVPLSQMTPPTPDARLETISGKRRVFTDGKRTLEIHDVGPNGHAEEMLVAWLPAEGIVFHADLVETPDGTATRGSAADATRQFGEYVRRQGWKPRIVGGSHSFLSTPEEFDKLLALPVLPPQ